MCIRDRSNNRSLQARQRLKIMETSNSGFDIAQKDLELRGPGDFFGIRQSGLPEFKLANLLTDVNVLKETQDAVKDILKEDRNLSKHIPLKKELFDKYLDEYNQAKKLYEEKWGPLTLDSEANKGKVWKWQKGWPFEGMGK